MAHIYDSCGQLTILVDNEQIPFVVIVQAHLLKDKGSVRLRRIIFDTTMETSGSSGNEQIVQLDNLAWTIRALSTENSGGLDDAPEEQPATLLHNQSSNFRETSNTKITRPSVDCIFVDQDQYFGSDRPVSKSETSSWKAVLKVMKVISQRGESFLSSLLDQQSGGIESLPIFAVSDVSFWVLRDFGTTLMKRSAVEQSAIGACLEITEHHPKHKRVFKTLGLAIDSYMRRNGFWLGGSLKHDHHAHQSIVTCLLYSKVDDRFDMVTLQSQQVDRVSSDNQGRSSRKK